MRWIDAMKICNEDMQQRYAIKICNTDMQQRYTIKTCNQDIQWRSAIKICNDHMSDSMSSWQGGDRSKQVFFFCFWFFPQKAILGTQRSGANSPGFLKWFFPQVFRLRVSKQWARHMSEIHQEFLTQILGVSEGHRPEPRGPSRRTASWARHFLLTF